MTRTPSGESATSSDVLQLIAEGVTAVAGFGVAVISAVRGDQFEVMAIAGPPEANQALAGHRMPVDALLEEIQEADCWGQVRFLPRERMSDNIDDYVWTPDFEPAGGPDAWHPDDLLVALLHDEDGDLRGLLSMDLPVDGRRPSRTQQDVLRHYADQAGRAVVAALEQETLAARMRLTRTSRLLVREATAQPSQVDLLQTVRHLLRDGFDCGRVAMYVFGESGANAASAPDDVPLELTRAAERWARHAWPLQQTMRVPDDVLDPDHPLREQYLAFLGRSGLASLLVVPLGAGHEVVGCLSLGRTAGAPPWSEAETDIALDIGHDLGRALLNARTLERERRLARDKDELVTTLAHELMTPITAIVGHVELMRDGPVVDDDVRRGLDAVTRGATRLQVMARDLIRLAATDDPSRPLRPLAVDLEALVAEVVEFLGGEAAHREVRIETETPDTRDPAVRPVAAGDERELLRVLFNLVGNAVKYSEPGGQVTVRVCATAEGVVVEVVDRGLGISGADQGQLFTEFFRSSNPAAAARPGTGLGLTIVRRTVARHGGTVEVDSTLGVGSTFRVVLPRWVPGSAPTGPEEPEWAPPVRRRRSTDLAEDRRSR